MFIDGKYVDAQSGKTFDDVNPATGEVIAHVAEGGKADVDRGRQGGAQSVRRGPVAEDAGRRTLGDPDEGRGRDQGADARALRARVARYREADPRDLAPRHPALGVQLRVLRRADQVRGHASLPGRRQVPQLLGARTGRRRGLHQPVEPAAAAAHLEARAGAGVREHGRLQAAEVHAAHRELARRDRERSRDAAGRAQRAAGLRAPKSAPR